MSENTSEFTIFLQKEFDLRKSRNKMYSLRAFSKFLGVNQSVVSRILSEKTRPSAKYIEEFGIKLAMSMEDIQRIIRAENAINAIAEDDRYKTYKQITVDSMEILSNWYNIAILFMRDVDNKIYSMDVLKEKLGLPETDIQASLDRLERLDLISNNDGVYEVINEQFFSVVESENAEDLAKNFMREMLNKSLDALELLPKEKRVHSSLTMSFNPERISQARVMIDNFRKKFLSTFDHKSSSSGAYTLQMSLFPLSNQEEEE